MQRDLVKHQIQISNVFSHREKETNLVRDRPVEFCVSLKATKVMTSLDYREGTYEACYMQNGSFSQLTICVISRVFAEP